MAKDLTFPTSTQQWFMKKYLVTAMPRTASVEGGVDSERGNNE